MQTAKPREKHYLAANDLIEKLADNNMLSARETQMWKNQLSEILSYFFLYGYLPLYTSLSSDDSEKVEYALGTLTSSPWLGSSGESYKEPFKKMTAIGFLEYKNMHCSSDPAVVFVLPANVAAILNLKEVC